VALSLFASRWAGLKNHSDSDGWLCDFFSPQEYLSQSWDGNLKDLVLTQPKKQQSSINVKSKSKTLGFRF